MIIIEVLTVLFALYPICDFADKGEVLGDNYKLLPVDLRDIQMLNEVINLANMDPRLVNRILSEVM